MFQGLNHYSTSSSNYCLIHYFPIVSKAAEIFFVRDVQLFMVIFSEPSLGKAVNTIATPVVNQIF